MGDIDKNDSSNRQFFAAGRELGNIIDGEKKKKLTLKLIQLLQGNDRTTLLEEIMRVLVVNQIAIPVFISEKIMKSTDDDLHLSIGKFIEGLNSEKKSKTQEEQNGKD